MNRTSNLPTRVRARQVSAFSTGARVYLAAPKAEYESVRYQRLAAFARNLLPHANVIEARTAFVDVADWRTNWPAMLASITALVFLTTPDGWIGRGVWAEVQEAHVRVPVYLLTDRGQLVPYADVVFSRPNPDNWTQHVRVTARTRDSNAA
jgi:hypothetical protein